MPNSVYASMCRTLAPILFAAIGSGAAGQIPAEAVNLESSIPLDSAVASGTLKNGLRYFVRVNQKPEKRAELRLAVNAGSVLEDDDQRGLAHFTEHMAFNGTTHFKKQDLVYTLESMGMAFGPEINASTGFDETVYRLTVPTDSAGALETGFLVLEDWARGIAFDPEEINKERGVVVEEWRQGRGADARMQDKQYPVLFQGSRYAVRLPIGDKGAIESFRPEALRRFYGDWYRPDLMAVVAVGDFEPSAVMDLIRRHFEAIPAPVKPKPREVFPVPDHAGTLFAIAWDTEATGSDIGVYFKSARTPENTVADYRRIIVENLFDAMMNERLVELIRRPDPPFLYAVSGKGTLVRSKGVYYLGAGVKDNGIERGLKVLFAETERVRRHGFTAGELGRAKAELLRGLEKAYAESNKTESSRFASELVRLFLNGEPAPGIAWELRLSQDLVPGISLEEINRLPGEWIADANRVVLVDLPDKPGVAKPTEKDLLAAIASVRADSIAPYNDDVLNQALVPVKPLPADIVKTKTNPLLGTTEWILSNGVRVVLKPTDFKNDEIRFTAFSPGGNSLVPNSYDVAAATAVSVVKEGGAGAFNAVQLEKKLAGRSVSVAPFIGLLTEGISGNASPRDVETLFQLVYLYFTAPREDSAAFASVRERMRGMLENRSQRPESAFQDTLQVTLARHHRRARPWSAAMLDEMNLAASLAVYRDRFADAGDFTFVFVGAFHPDSLRPLVQAYLGGLPTLGRKERWMDLGIRPPGGVEEKTVRRGLESKGRVAIVFTGPFDASMKNNRRLDAVAGFLRIRLRDRLREDLGGTYGVSVSPSVSRYPREEYSLSVSFSCSPDRIGELSRRVFGEIDSLKAAGPKSSELAAVREILRRDHEVEVKANGYWASALSNAYFNGEDPRHLLEVTDWIRELTKEDIRGMAREVFNTKRYVKVVLLPEGGSPQ
jgi:zinc protease